MIAYEVHCIVSIPYACAWISICSIYRRPIYFWYSDNVVYSSNPISYGYKGDNMTTMCPNWPVQVIDRPCSLELRDSVLACNLNGQYLHNTHPMLVLGIGLVLWYHPISRIWSSDWSCYCYNLSSGIMLNITISTMLSL